MFAYLRFTKAKLFIFSLLVSNKIVMLKESNAIFWLNRDDVLVFGDINSTCPKKVFPRSGNSKI